MTSNALTRSCLTSTPAKGLSGILPSRPHSGFRKCWRAKSCSLGRKLTGGKGLHVMVSLPSPLTSDRGPSYARHMVQRLAPADRQRYVTSAAPKKRAGHTFLDYLRNERCTTTVGTYSLRAAKVFPLQRPSVGPVPTRRMSWRLQHREPVPGDKTLNIIRMGGALENFLGRNRGPARSQQPHSFRSRWQRLGTAINASPRSTPGLE